MKKNENVNSQKEAYCDGEPTESIRALLLLVNMPVHCNGKIFSQPTNERSMLIGDCRKYEVVCKREDKRL